MLDIRDLSVRYDRSGPWVLRDVSFQADAGAFILLTGPSGGGKTTLIKAINGILSGSSAIEMSGTVRVAGQDQAQKPAAERALHIGSILQNADEQIVFERVEDELAFALENMQVPPREMPARIAAAARLMRLNLAWPTRTLSGGQKQRLTTATTLGMGQKLLLLDEPLANLDKAGSTLLLQRLASLAVEQGYCVILSEHRLDRVLPYADRICWVEHQTLRSFEDKDVFKSFFQDQLSFALEHNSLAQRPPSGQADPAPGQTLIHLDKAGVALNGRQILHDIDFTLRRGDRWVVIGDNGAGKTSLLMLLTHCVKPTRGSRTAWIQDKQLFKKVGFVMQNPNYQLFMPTVRQEIACQAVSRRLFDEIITVLDLADVLERHPQSLSEGQKRRVGVAAILAMQPEVLLLDEPTVGQDYNSLGRMIRAIAQVYCDKPLTLVTLTHDSRCARFLGDQVLWLDQGTVRSRGDGKLLDELQA